MSTHDQITELHRKYDNGAYIEAQLLRCLKDADDGPMKDRMQKQATQMTRELDEMLDKIKKLRRKQEQQDLDIMVTTVPQRCVKFYEITEAAA